MNELKILDQREVLGKQFRVYGTVDTPLFLAKDVAEWIEYDTTNIGKILRHIDDGEKVRKIIPTLGGSQEVWMLTEDGLYEVLMQSRKPLAKEFKKQVKSILKSIRKYGMYAKDEILNNPELLLDVAQKLIDEKNKVKQLEEIIEDQKPKIEIYNEIINQNALLNFKQMAEIFGRCSRTKLFEILRDEHILSDNESNWNLPYSKYKKYFRVKITPRKTSDGMREICTTLCTTQSIPLIKGILDKKKDLQMAEGF